MAAVINIQHLASEDVGTGGSSQTAPTDFTAVSDLTKSVAFINNNRYQGGGPSGSTSNEEINDISLRATLTATDTLTWSRASGAADTNRGSASILEYTGSSGGAYEIAVRGRHTVTLTGATNTATLSTTPTDINACVPFITGITSDASNNGAHLATAIAWLSGSNTLNVQRANTTGTTIVEVTVVEFIGPSWTVHHGYSSTTAADTGTITLYDGVKGTGSTSSVNSWSEAWIVHQFVGDSSTNNQAIADTSAMYSPGGTAGEVDWQFDGNHDGVDNEHLVYVVESSDLNVTRFNSTASHTGASNVDITSAGLTDISSALPWITRETSGNGTAYGRGWVNIRLTSTTNAEMWVHRNGNNINTEIQVVDFSAMEESSAETGTAAGSFSFSASAAAVKAAKGSSSGALSFSSNATASRTAIGVASGSFGFTASASGEGNGTEVGTAAGAFSFGSSATGIRTAQAQASENFSFGSEGNATRVAKGLASNSFGFLSTASGSRTGVSTASGSFEFSSAASGSRTAVGSSTGSFAFSSSAVGTAAKNATASEGFGFSSTAQGLRTAIGGASGGFGFSSSASGTAAGGITGAASGSMAFGSTAAASKTGKATAANGFLFESFSLSKKTGKGVSAGSFTFNGSAVGKKPAGDYWFVLPSSQPVLSIEAHASSLSTFNRPLFVQLGEGKAERVS